MSDFVTFRAPWGRKTTAVTVTLMGLLVAIVLVLMIAGKNLGWHGTKWGFIGLLLSVVVPVAVLYALGRRGPREYVLTANNVIIGTPASDITIPLDDIADVRVVSDNEVFGDATRVWAKGGFFGFWGTFNSQKLENPVLVYVTDSERLVLMERENQHPVLVSPDDREEFARLVREAIADRRS